MSNPKLIPCPTCGSPIEAVAVAVSEYDVQLAYKQPALYESAPDMLEALEVLVNYVGGRDELYQKTLALIAKAKGGV
jgi:hypothetical protein